MSEISSILKELNLINYTFDEEENIFTSQSDNIYQIIELVTINNELDKNDIDYNIDKDNNIHLNI